MFSRPETAQRLQARFVPVKVNALQFPAVARQYEVTSWPTDVILAPNGQIVASLRCSTDQSTYLAGLEQVASVADPRLNNVYANINAATGATAAMVQPQPDMMTPTAAPQNALSANVEDRYAEYFRDRQQAPRPSQSPSSPVAQQQPPKMPVQSAPPAHQPNLQSPATVSPASGGQNPYSSLVSGQPSAVTVPAPMAGPPATAPSAAGMSTAPPAAPLALEGHCPVELVEHERWVRGDRRFGAIHRGQTYLFTGAEQQKRFLANPDNYGPAMSGADPVLALEARQMVPGLRKHGLFYNNRVYLFSNEATLAQFCRSPARYADGVRIAEGANRGPVR